MAASMTTVNELIGKAVIGSKAHTIGYVNGVEVDLATWQVTHLHVTLTNEATKELGFKKPFMGAINVCLPVSLIQAVADIVALNKDTPELKDVIEPRG